MMYALCIDNNGVMLHLEKGKEYEVVAIRNCQSNYADTFYILSDGLAYASCHFSVTYTK